MSDLLYRFTEFIDASPHEVFDYCRDPGRIYAGDPMYTLDDVTVAPEGVGTRARVLAKMPMGTEEVLIEYVEFVPDERIVFDANPKMTLSRIGREMSMPVHTWTWTFAAEGSGTRLNVVVVENGPAWWEHLLSAISIVEEKMFSAGVRERLRRIKVSIEEQPAAVA